MNEAFIYDDTVVDADEQNFRFSPELQAVLTIFVADPELTAKALPYVDLDERDIDWYMISQNNFGSGHFAAISFAKAIWTGEMPLDSDLFNRATSMDVHLKRVVLRAFAIAWGV